MMWIKNLKTPFRVKLNKRYFLLFLLIFIVSCGKTAPDLPVIEPITSSSLEIDAVVQLPAPTHDFVEDATFDVETAVYYDLINTAIPLTAAERDMLTQNGFVITDRLNWNRFIEAYAWIYKNDLPVIITSDSVLHAVHQSYSNLLQQLEASVIHPELVQMLKVTRAQVAADANEVNDEALAILYQDVEDYLTVAIILAEGEALRVNGDPFNNKQHGYWPKNDGALTLDLSQLAAYNSPRVNELVKLAWEADSATDLNSYNGIELTLFNNPRTIDFTLFQPRAHYNNMPLLGNYFRAMSWLAQADFRFVEFDIVTNEPMLNQDSIVAAKILQEAIDKADQRQNWASINTVFEQLVGVSDNTALPDFDRLNADMGWASAQDVLNSNSDQILDQLLSNDYGQQRITGQLIGRYIDNDSTEPIPRPVSFMLFGQRFALDPWVMGQVVYDQLMQNGVPVERPLPTGFDVMVALGNDHATTHLQPELDQYNYEPTLATLRQRIDNLDNSFWQAPIYNQWLQMIRSLNAPTTAANYPPAMQTAVWADKNLHTQLASWAQLRHDNILYVKQSYSTGQIACEFPSVYVEPQPALYQALYDFAQNGSTLVDSLDGYDNKRKEPLQDYFENVAESAQLLAEISEKELAQTPLTTEEQQFLASLVVKQSYNPGCGGVSFEEMWDGWYTHLIYGKDESPAIIADMHTNPTNDSTSALYPPRVLHVGTGPATVMLMIVDAGEGPALHVGPAFAYYEFAEEGFPPVRLNDQQWREALKQESDYPTAPSWVNSFRITVDTPPMPFALPQHNQVNE